MDYKKIVKNAKKYHYYVVTTNKTVCISMSNKKSEAKKMALEKLEPNINNLIGKNLVVVKIKSVAKEYEKQKTSGELKIIGGPIILKFEKGLIRSPKKISNFVGMENDKIYLSDKYIKKHQYNIAFNLNKLVDDVMERKINQGLLAMTIL